MPGRGVEGCVPVQMADGTAEGRGDGKEGVTGGAKLVIDKCEPSRVRRPAEEPSAGIVGRVLGADAAAIAAVGANDADRQSLLRLATPGRAGVFALIRDEASVRRTCGVADSRRHAPWRRDDGRWRRQDRGDAAVGDRDREDAVVEREQEPAPVW